MRATLVTDVDNSCYSYILSEANSDDLVLAYNFFASQRLYSKLQEYPKKINISSLKNYLKTVTQKNIINELDIGRKLMRSGFLNNFSDYIERQYVISCLTQLYKGQLMMQQKNTEEFFKTYNPYKKIKYEDYLKYIDIVNNHEFYTIEKAMEEAIAKGIKRRYRRLFLPFYESYGKLGYEFISNCIDFDEIILIGDKYKHSNYYASECPYNYNRTINLSDTLYFPEEYVKLYEKIKNKINVPYKSVLNGRKGYYRKVYNLKKGIEIFKDLIADAEFILVAYDIPLFASHIESKLFEEGIPFRGIVPEYKFPHEVYKVFFALQNLLNNEPLTYKQIRTIIQSLNAKFTDYYGGKAKLFKTYTLPVYVPSILNRSKLFGYLRMLLIKGELNKALQPELAHQYSMWRYKLRKEWINPKCFSATIAHAKTLNADVILYIDSVYTDNYNALYTAMCISKKMVHVKLGANTHKKEVK